MLQLCTLWNFKKNQLTIHTIEYELYVRRSPAGLIIACSVLFLGLQSSRGGRWAGRLLHKCDPRAQVGYGAPAGLTGCWSLMVNSCLKRLFYSNNKIG